MVLLQRQALADLVDCAEIDGVAHRDIAADVALLAKGAARAM
jgi:hypothetical protein